MSDEKELTRGAGKPRSKNEHRIKLGLSYLFIIGVDDYKYTTKLNNAVRDAQAVRDILLTRYNFSEEHLYELYNEEVTEDNIVAILESLHAEVKDTDSLLIYFSGHGQYNKIIDEGYWVPVNGEEKRKSTLIPFGTIRKYIRAIPSRHTLVLADSCFSGSVVNYKSISRADAESYNLTSRWILTAGRNEVVADGPPGTHSPFAKSLLAQLDANQRPWLNINRLGMNVREGVSANSEQIPSIGPIVDTGHQGGAFIFILKGSDPPLVEVNIREEAGEKRSSEGNTIETTSKVEEAPKPKPPSLPLDSLSNIKKGIKLALANSDFDKAFEILNKVVKEDTSLEMLMLQLQGQYNGARKDKNKGIISTEHHNLTMNRIRNSISETIKDMDEEDVNLG